MARTAVSAAHYFVQSTNDSFDEDDSINIDDLYRDHSEFCLNVAIRVTRDRQLAEDAMQDAFLDLWLHQDRVDLTRGGIVNWLATLAQRRAVDVVRREETHHGHVDRVAAFFTGEHDPSRGPEDLALAAHQAPAVRAALANLSAPAQQVLILAYFYGMTQVEIATATGVALGTVKTRTKSALSKLRLALPELWPT
jgi:RNA polymerase sigma factor (sigma-70 family)